MSTIGLYGNSIGIERVLKRVGVRQESCWSEKGNKWRAGTRSWSGLLSRECDQGRRLIGPSTILFNPVEAAGTTDDEPKKTQRQLLIRIHPSAFLELFNELLRLIKMENPRLYIEDLRFEIGSIELTGPASTETLLATLTPFPDKTKRKNQHAELFQSLAGLTNPAALPVGSVLSFQVQDPRLQYPPRRVEVDDDADAQMALLEKIASWPAGENLEPYAIFNRDARHWASCFPPQKHINRRRSKNDPGTPLKPVAIDPPFPITLLAGRPGAGAQMQGTWTLLAPWKCILPIWYTIVHCPLSSGGNPRFAGLNETRQVAFERGLPWFPGDFPGTQAGAAWELKERRKRRAVWERRPKSKRVEWKSLDLGAGRKGEVGDGLANNFEMLLAPVEESLEYKVDAMDVDGDNSAAPAKADTTRLQLFNQISKNSINELITSPTPPAPVPSNELVTVRISLLARGVVTSCARIYRLPSSFSAPPSSDAEVPATIPPMPTSSSSSIPTDLRKRWLARVPSSTTPKGRSSRNSQQRDLSSLKRQLALELISRPAEHGANQSDIGGHPLVPDVDDLVGFVTTGSFSLSEGRGVAIGSVALDRIIQGVRQDPKEGRLCIVRNAGENVGWIARWEAI